MIPSDLPPGVGSDDPHINGYDEGPEEKWYEASLAFARTLTGPEDFDRVVTLARLAPLVIEANETDCDCHPGIKADTEIFAEAGYTYSHQYEDPERTSIALTYCPVGVKEAEEYWEKATIDEPDLDMVRRETELTIDEQTSNE